MVNIDAFCRFVHINVRGFCNTAFLFSRRSSVLPNSPYMSSSWSTGCGNCCLKLRSIGHRPLSENRTQCTCLWTIRSNPFRNTEDCLSKRTDCCLKACHSTCNWNTRDGSVCGWRSDNPLWFSWSICCRPARDTVRNSTRSTARCLPPQNQCPATDVGTSRSCTRSVPDTKSCPVRWWTVPWCISCTVRTTAL